MAVKLHHSLGLVLPNTVIQNRNTYCWWGILMNFHQVVFQTESAKSIKPLLLTMLIKIVDVDGSAGNILHNKIMHNQV